jgi:hypothetical protein
MKSLRPILLAVVALGSACGEDPPEAPAGCDSLSGIQRDQCILGEIEAVPGAQPDVVIAKAGTIQDPMIRGAAVSKWVADHSNELPPEKGQELCNLLSGRDRSYCQRRLSSPHLQPDR